MQIGIRPLRRADPDWASECIRGGFGSGEALIADVADAPIAGPEEEPVAPRDTRRLILEDEFARVLAVAARDGSTLSMTCRNAWDGRPLEARTKGLALKATHAHIGVLAGITAEELRRKTPETELCNGFLNRFLLAAVKRTRLLPRPPKIPADFDAEYTDRFGAALAWAWRNAQEIERDGEAAERWDEVYGTMLSIDRPGLAGAACSRAEAHALRLSALYALLDKSTTVTRAHLEAALAVWRYCETTAQIVFGDRIGDSDADRIIEALSAAPGGRLSRSEIGDLFSRHKSREEIDGILDLLEALGRIHLDRTETGGRPAVILELVPQ
jgi:hypothetical protein